ncbi:MAG: helix-turn-helix domain-containing protein [Limimaricola soesokkakensis]|uniref:helix-turn-helix domain-containing protein n=1 Tax=Limimaricola soesokkakensis TaxID=1343159 RepID=UPI004058527E
MVTIGDLNLYRTPAATDLAATARARRLGLNMTQEALSEASGVPLSTLKKFERSGQVSLISFLVLCDALGVGHAFDGIIPPVSPVSASGTSELIL